MAAPRLTLDPNLESCPDYSSASFRNIRDLLVAGSANGTPLTDAEAATQLVDSWNSDNDARKLLWDAQVQADTDARTAQAEIDRVAAEAAAEATRVEAENKKSKIGAFDPTLVIPDSLGPRASNFAKKKVEDKEYVELWYWTKEGCLDAESVRGGVEADESYGITQVGTSLSFKPLTAYKASSKVIRDENLTWDQLFVAIVGFLAAIEAAGWPIEHRSALSSFFYALSSHSSRMEHDDCAETILIIYQARARRSWHDSLSIGRGFNIAIINDQLLGQFAREFHNKLRSSGYRAVRELI